MNRFTAFLITVCVLLTGTSLTAQILTSNGATVYVSPGGSLFCNGGVTLTNTSDLTNNGIITTTKNATSPQPGNFTLTSSSNAQGNGDYYVEQDWVNDANFSAQSSTVNLYGNTEQLITSTNGTITEFNDLTLSGTGSGIDRRKTLQDVDARISLTGVLQLNDRELYTQGNEMLVLNPSTAAIVNDLTYGAEGFVSSDQYGNLGWYTNSANGYVFPVGSSNGTLRYRPVSVQPYSSASNLFKVHLNNVLADTYGYPIGQHDNDLMNLNPNYYHSITRPSGTSSADISIAYDLNEDGEWMTIGQWHVNNALWNWVGETAITSLGAYSSVTKSAWIFEDPSEPYILANVDNTFLIPNTFTPDGDGVNDLYYITANNLSDFNMIITNRWGQVVFETNDINIPWDGKWKGNPCTQGTYFYIINAKSSAGDDVVKQGFITLN